MTNKALAARGSANIGTMRLLPKVDLGRLLLYLVILVLSLIFVFPFFYTFSSSLKQSWEMFVYPPVLWPSIPQFRNYARIFEVVPFGSWLMNTIRVVILSTTGSVVSSSLVAYSLSRFQYRGRDLLFFITLATMMLPAQVTLIPQFVLFYRLQWLNTIKPLWVPAWFGGGAFNIFLMRQFILTLPRELDEAALIDGASRFRVFWKILLPLCKPVLATMAVISFMGNWADFMGPLIYLNSPEKFTLAIGLNYLRTVPEVTVGERLENVLMAACILNILPCLIVFFFAQRYFVRGIVTTGLKG
jgi:multiple sugar transport system permease protein